MHFLERGALSYVVDVDDKAWGPKFSDRQQIDMVIFNESHVSLVELKETDSLRRKKIGFKQIERYHYFCRDAKYKTEFWAFVYWKNYNVITGVKMPFIENLQIFCIDTTGKNEFWASIGLDPAKRIRKKVDLILEI